MLRNTGIVIIGQNEGERLRRCIRSVAGRAAVAVYVDSGSTDGSAWLARSVGCEVVELDPAAPFTAARGRNAGLARLRELHPGLEFVQFIDGDCELHPDWLDRAAREFAARPDVAIVCGHLHERSPDVSIYNRLCELEWKGSVGEIDWCGGIFMARADAVRAAGAFNASMIGGEEPELCLRLRRAGWQIVRVDAPMAVHDAAMTRLGQWLARAVRAGRAYAASASLHGNAADRGWSRQIASNLTWGLALPLMAAISLAASFLLPAAALGAAVIAAGYAALFARICRYRIRLGDRSAHAALYALFCIISKLPQCWGMWLHWNDQRRAHGGDELPAVIVGRVPVETGSRL